MSLQESPLETVHSDHPLTAELAAVVAALVALSIWQHVARAYVVPAAGFAPGGPGFDAVDSLLVAGAVTGGILLAGAVAVVGAYVAVRDLDVGLALPAARRPAVVAVAAALYGLERFERPWLRYLSPAPVVLLVGGTVVAGIAAVGTVSAVLFVGVKVAVLAVAAATYERTDSLLAPALTYACFLAASEAVVFFLEAGVGPA